MSKYLWLALVVAGMAPFAHAAGAFSISVNRKVGLPGKVHVRVNVPKSAENRLLIYGFDNGRDAENTEVQLDEYTTGGIFERDFTVHYPGPIAFVAVLETKDGKTKLERVEACYGGAEDGC